MKTQYEYILLKIRHHTINKKIVANKYAHMILPKQKERIARIVKACVYFIII